MKAENGYARSCGLREDMDALPILDATGLPYASKTLGKMHACELDGHTVMLLGAKYLCETHNFDGAAAPIFQPAEEGGAGGKAMVKDGMMRRFGIKEVYGFVAKTNRRSQSKFSCPACGQEINADVSAARNLENGRSAFDRAARITKAESLRLTVQRHLERLITWDRVISAKVPSSPYCGSLRQPSAPL